MPVEGQKPSRVHFVSSESVMWEAGDYYPDPNDSTKLVRDFEGHRISTATVSTATSGTLNGESGQTFVFDDASPATAIARTLDSTVADGWICDILNESTQTATLTPSSGDINDGTGAASSKTLAAGTSCRLSKTSSGSPSTAHWKMLKGSSSTTGGTGDVVGPSSSTNNDFALFDGTTGKLIKDGGISKDTDAALAANSDSRLATQKAVRAFVLANSGSGAAFINPWTGRMLKGSRATATVYQNATSNWLLVMVLLNRNGTGTAQGLTDSSNPPTTAVATMSGASSFVSYLHFFVAPGDYYEVTGTNISSVNEWREYEITRGSITNSGDVSGSRAFNTVYQNTTSDVMFLVINIGTGGTTSVLSDNANPPTQAIWTQGTIGGTASQTFVPILPGDYYKVTNATGTIVSWREYQWTGVTVTRTTDLVAVKSIGAGIVTLFKNAQAGALWVAVTSTTSATATIILRNDPVSVGNNSYSSGVSLVLDACSSTGSTNKMVCGPIGAGEWLNVFNDASTPTIQHWFEWLIT